VRDREFWAGELWPLIVRVVWARQDRDVDGYAEEDLQAVLILRRGSGP
jgi:hypothetical protein